MLSYNESTKGIELFKVIVFVIYLYIFFDIDDLFYYFKVLQFFFNFFRNFFEMKEIFVVIRIYFDLESYYVEELVFVYGVDNMLVVKILDVFLVVNIWVVVNEIKKEIKNSVKEFVSEFDCVYNVEVDDFSDFYFNIETSIEFESFVVKVQVESCGCYDSICISCNEV